MKYKKYELIFTEIGFQESSCYVIFLEMSHHFKSTKQR